MKVEIELSEQAEQMLNELAEQWHGTRRGTAGRCLWNGLRDTYKAMKGRTEAPNPQEERERYADSPSEAER